MSGVGKKTPGIGQHTDKVREQSEVCKGGHLCDDSRLVIVEPPGTSVLDLAHGFRSLETADDACNRLIIIWIQRIQNRLWKAVRSFESIQKISGLGTWCIVIDTVITGVWTKFCIHCFVIVALAAIMDLHYPVSSVVFSCDKLHECHLKLHFFFACHAISVQCFFENSIDFFQGSRRIHDIFQCVIRYAAADLGKIIHPVTEG